MIRINIKKSLQLAIITFLGLLAHSSSAQSVVKVFVLAGQSNMQGQGKMYVGSNGALGVTMASFTPSCEELGTETCEFTFNMMDGYGDGWNGWTYDFIQDEVVMATETLDSGTEGTATVTLEDGVLCEIVVNNPGAYGGEISWTLTDSFGEIQASLTGQDENYPSPNTLTDVIENDEDENWSMLEFDGDWAVFENVFIHFENGNGTLIQDHVTAGQGASPNLIGPELMFAYQMDEYFEDPVLIIKTAWGGLSLAEDFRPPSSGGTTGFYYNEMIDIVENVTQNLESQFPDLGTSEYEITGFAWFQGWNDAGSDDFLNEYESNLYNLIDDVRNDFGNPELPVVVASAGQGGYEDHWGWMQDVQDIIAVAQENVACDDELYGGTVGFVNTKPFYMPVEESPDDAGFHYHNNALTFLNVGKSIGEEMILAINDLAFCSDIISVEDVQENDDLVSIYPNPTTDLFVLNLTDNYKSGSVVIRNMLGKVIQSHEYVNSDRLSFSLDESAGIYIVSVESGEQSKTFRLIKE